MQERKLVVNYKYSTIVLLEQDKWTPLMYAVKEGHTDVVKVLLEQKELEILAVNKVCEYLCIHLPIHLGVWSMLWLLLLSISLHREAKQCFISLAHMVRSSAFRRSMPVSNWKLLLRKTF